METGFLRVRVWEVADGLAGRSSPIVLPATLKEVNMSGGVELGVGVGSSVLREIGASDGGVGGTIL